MTMNRLLSPGLLFYGQKYIYLTEIMPSKTSSRFETSGIPSQTGCEVRGYTQYRVSYREHGSLWSSGRYTDCHLLFWKGNPYLFTLC